MTINMTNIIDLQIQSKASDGVHPPRELIRMARERNIEVLSLTDHDTVAGVSEALEAGGELGVRVIPGIEISVEDRGAHILGYGIDCKNPLLNERLLEVAKKSRLEAAQKMVENLKKAGFQVEWEDVLREVTGSVVARPHIAQAVLRRPENKEKLGGIKTVHDFIGAHLTDESPNYFPRAHIRVSDAITLIHEIGGVAIWSHPAIHFNGDYEALGNFLGELRRAELDGVEVFNPSHTEDDVEFLQTLTAKYELLTTAGSDYHGFDTRVPSQGEEGSPRGEEGMHSAQFIGDYQTYGFSTEKIVTLLDEAIRRSKRRIVGQK